jgi:hypothetical protein
MRVERHESQRRQAEAGGDHRHPERVRQPAGQLRSWTVFIGMDGSLQRAAEEPGGNQWDPVQAADGDGLEAGGAWLTKVLALTTTAAAARREDQVE